MMDTIYNDTMTNNEMLLIRGCCTFMSVALYLRRWRMHSIRWHN